MDKKSFIQNIIKTRKSKKITQKKLSELTGISQQVLSKVEQEDSNPKLDTLIAIANAMNCRIEFVDKKDNSIMRLTTNREWLDKQRHITEYEQLETEKLKVEKDIERVQRFLDFRPDSEHTKERLQKKKKQLAMLQESIAGYKSCTVRQLFKNIEKNNDNYDEDDVIQEMESYIQEVDDYTDTIRRHLYISCDLFNCIEACKDLCAMFEVEKNKVNLNVIKEIIENISSCKEQVDELAESFYYLLNCVNELEATISDNI